MSLLPPAYVVRGKGLFSQVSVCSHLRGVLTFLGGGVGLPTFPVGGGGGSTYLPRQGGTYLPRQGYLPWWGVPTFPCRGVPTLAGGTYLGRGVPTLVGGYLPWWGGYLPWQGVPTLVGGYLPSQCVLATWWAVCLVFTQKDFLV